MPRTSTARTRTAPAATPSVADSQAAHSAAVKAKQSAERKASRPTKPATADIDMGPVVNSDGTPTDATIEILRGWRATAEAPAEVLAVVDSAIRRGARGPRSVKAKAEPAEVARFFVASGLTRKQIAAAVGVTTSVIATVQNENGDRWSAERFERAKPLILAAAEAARATAAAEAKGGE
jgi:hypothetical protein